MKKIIYSAMAVAMLATTSCKDDFAETFVGDQATVEFSISSGDIATRAYSDGKTVDHVHYAIYEKVGENSYQLTGLYTDENSTDEARQVVALTEGKATINVALKTGKDYQAIFWADDVEAPYTVVFGDEGATMSVDYATAKANDERRDAFYASVPVNISGNESKTVTLTRPFAQLNVGTNDYVAAANAGYTPTLSSITVHAYSGMDLMTGNVTGNQEIKTFDYAPIPGKVDGVDEENFPVDGYEYLAMTYILVGDDVTSEVTFGYKEDAAATEETKNVGSVPLKRNYRTNIYGKLLTSKADINVEINPDYEVGTLVYDKKTLQDAIDAAPENATTVITLGANIEANVTDIQKPGRKVVIDGRGYKYNGTIKVHSNSNHYADAALTIKNLNFETSTASVNFIEALENGSERYSSNITVEKCTFTATGAAENTAVGVQIKASKNAKVIDCKATNVHSLIQAQSCDESVLVQKCTVTGKNGVAFKQVKSATVEGTTITAREYGIRFDGNTDNYGITVKKNTVNAKQPLIVRKMTGANNTIALEGTNTLITGETYQIVITNGSDDETYVKPTGTYTLTGADNFTIFPKPIVAKVGNTEYTSIDEAIAAWTNNSTLTLLANVTLNDVVTLKSTEHHTLNLGTYTMTAAKGKDAISITAEGRSSASYALDIKADATNPGGITATSKAVVKTTGKTGVKDRPIIRFYNGVFNASNIISHSGSNGTNCPQFQFHGGVYNGSLTANRALIQIYGGTFNGRFYISVDSSAYALISGGKFKYMDNLYGSALNSDKFTIGSSKGNFDRGVYVDDEGYIVVGGPVITEFGDKFAAKATNASTAGSYLTYSSAAANGLYYTNADMAIAKHGEANVVLK